MPADKVIDLTDLKYYHDQFAATEFASQSDLDTLEDRVDDIIAEGGEPNVIETVKVNGTALVPDANKAVDVTVPTKVSDLTNDGDGTQGSAFATEDYVDQNGGKIDVIKVNGTTQTITNKAVDIAVPKVFVAERSVSTYGEIRAAVDAGDAIMFGPGGTSAQWPNIIFDYSNTNPRTFDIRVIQGTALIKYIVTEGSGWSNGEVVKQYAEQNAIPDAVSDLTNDAGYQTASDVATAIGQAISSAYKYKGSVATYADLPSSGLTAGDVYDVQATGINYAWTGTAWDALGQYVDTSLFWNTADYQIATTAEIDAIFS